MTKLRYYTKYIASGSTGYYYVHLIDKDKQEEYLFSVIFAPQQALLISRVSFEEIKNTCIPTQYTALPDGLNIRLLSETQSVIFELTAERFRELFLPFALNEMTFRSIIERQP